MESTLPPLFDHMDNIDISSPNDDTDIFKSAIQVFILEREKVPYFLLLLLLIALIFRVLKNHYYQ
jgi:hypothetical protein